MGAYQTVETLFSQLVSRNQEILQKKKKIPSKMGRVKSKANRIRYMILTQRNHRNDLWPGNVLEKNVVPLSYK